MAITSGASRSKPNDGIRRLAAQAESAAARAQAAKQQVRSAKLDLKMARKASKAAKKLAKAARKKVEAAVAAARKRAVAPRPKAAKPAAKSNGQGVPTRRRAGLQNVAGKFQASAAEVARSVVKGLAITPPAANPSSGSSGGANQGQSAPDGAETN